jgi:hypothetical protein
VKGTAPDLIMTASQTSSTQSRSRASELLMAVHERPGVKRTAHSATLARTVIDASRAATSIEFSNKVC